jgi:hypothetical protein
MRNNQFKFLAALAFLFPACDSATPAAGTPEKTTTPAVTFSSPVSGPVVKVHGITMPPFDASGPGSQQLCSVDSQCALWAGACLQAHCLRGECVRTTAADGTTCEDFDKCTVATICRRGACTGIDACIEIHEFWPYYPVPPYPLEPTTP